MELIQNTAKGLDHQTIVLFDGVCHLCNGFIKFYHDKRKGENIRYVPLDSQEAKLYIKEQAIQGDLDTVIILKNGQTFVKSDAVIELIKETKFPWNLISLISILPKGILDGLYGFIAKHRYKLFGKTDRCVVNHKE